jgi:hypothetical protein
MLVAACGHPRTDQVSRPASRGPVGIVMWTNHERAGAPAVLRWNDLDAGATGSLPHDLSRAASAVTTASDAAWIYEPGQQLEIMRPATGPGVIASPIAGERLDAVSRDGTRAIADCTRGYTCQVGALTAGGITDPEPVGSGLPHDERVDLEAWLPDGRVVFQQRQAATIWYVDPRTAVATRGPVLPAVFSSISDDGSLVAWDVDEPPGTDRRVLSWRQLPAGDVRTAAFELAHDTDLDCRFAPVRHALLCLARLATDPETDGAPRRLFVIDTATGAVRALATGVTVHVADRVIPSPDGRYVAAPVRDGSGIQIVAFDLVDGARYPLGTAARYDAPIGWLAPR